LFFRFADTVVAVSHGASNDLIQSRIATTEQVRVIYDPVITHDILQKARESIDHSWFRQKKIPIILGVGRLTELKDYPTLIKAFAGVRVKLPARLVILGEGEDRPRLESLVRNLELEKEVAMPGFVDNPFAYMARASVFVLSSLLEGLPNVLIQAMAVGTPVVSTNCPNGPREILGDGKYGILVPVGDVERLSQAIVDTLQQRHKVIPKNWLDQFEFQHSVHAYMRVLGYSSTR